MRTGGVCTAALLFLATLVIQVSTAEDIYWEGENGEESEFLEVKEESPPSHLTRLKRNFNSWFRDSLFPSSSKTTTEAPENYEAVTEDEDDTADLNDYDSHADGSGAVPERVEPDPSEKTLRVSFVVMEPFLDDYSNRDSELFKTFSYNLANAVNALFDAEPGTQKASLVRIQSRPSDNFSCKVTLDIVTTADNTNRIAELLHTHIRNTRKLGNYTLTDSDYSANVVNPGSPFEKCQPDELQCNDGHCVPGSSICDGVNDCSDGSDEHDKCPNFDTDQRRDDSIEQVETPRARCSEPISCASSAVTICPEQKCNGYNDCPGGEDEDPSICSPPTPERGDQSFTTAAPVEDTTKILIPLTDKVCSAGEFSCDEGEHCILNSQVCDQEPDCTDGTDEAACNREHCGLDDFKCGNNKCIDISKRCNRVVDCPDREDERDCDCTPNDFRCNDDGSCIEIRKRCDGTTNCRDGSDELDCACAPDQWQCDQGNCIKRSKRCNGHVDCPSDRSDERNCVAHGYFKCQTGKVIPDSMRCNRRYDCQPGDYSDEQNCPCGDDDFRCNNGHCIQAYKRCDRTHDCQDGSDELHCKYGTDCMAYEYKCTSGECVHAEAICNGTVECTDGSDESKCPCKRGQFLCQDGSCINIALRCDGHKDCRKGEDELNCDPCADGAYVCPRSSRVLCATPCNDIPDCDNGEDEEQCNNIQDECAHVCGDNRCLDKELICDGTSDCLDGSDETACDFCDKPEDYRCDDFTCISQNERCNNIEECPDGSDEKHCNETLNAKRDDCPDRMFTCSDGSCVNPDFHCDGNIDCVDGSDEIGCPCQAGQFQCDQDRCMQISFRCNGHNDCYDGTDESPEYCARPSTEYYYSAPSTPSPIYPTSRETYVSGSAHSVPVYSPYAPSTVRPQTNEVPSDDDDDREDRDRNGIDNTITTQASVDGRFYTYGTDRPESNNPYGIEQSGSYEPYDSNQAGSNVNVPHGSNQAGSNNPYGSNQDGSNNPYGSNQDGSNNPYGSNQDGSNNPYGSNQDGSNNPSGSNQDGSNNPYGSNQDGSNNPYGSNQDGSNNPSGSNQDGLNNPYGSNQDGSNNPYGSNQDGSNNPYGSNQDGSNNPYGSNQDGSNNPSGSNQDGSNNPYGSNQDGSNNPYGSNQDGSNNPYGSNQDGSNNPYGSNQDGSNNPSGSNQDGLNNPYGSNQDGSNNPYGSNQDGSNNPYGSNQDGSNNPYGSNQDGSNNPYGSNQDGSNNPYGSNQDGSNNPYGSNQDGSNNPYGSNQDGSNNPYGSNQDGSNNPYGSNQDGSNGSYDSNQLGSNSDNRAPEQSDVVVSGGGTSVNCTSFEWSCEKGSCINANRRCDGHIDCPYDFSDEFDCPAGSPVALNVKIYPKDGQTQRFGGDVVFQCREEGPLRARVRWYREGGRSLKANSTEVRGRLELFQVTMSDSGEYICQAQDYAGQVGSEVRVHLTVKSQRPIIEKPKYVPCNANEATCTNGACILRSAICDGNVDCPDRSDEDMCPYNGKCEPNQFQCANRKCVLKSWLCDSDDDCGDNSDEKSCIAADSNSVCLLTEFSCHSNDQCIPKSFHCDGSEDCVDRSDEVGCSRIYVTKPPSPANVRLNPGDTLVLTCQAVGVPMPIISWRLNWGHVPSKCTWTNIEGVGILTCPNMMPEDSGAYSCEGINPVGTVFGNPDSIVSVTQNNPCPDGYFNNEARSQNECIRCFCFGKSTRCHSADLFTFHMPTALGEGGTRLLGVALSDDGAVRTDPSIINHYYYQPLRNARRIIGATVTKLEFQDETRLGSFHPFLMLPESYNGDQLTSYGGHIKYTIHAHNNYPNQDGSPSIIIKGKYATLFHVPRNDLTSLETNIEARFVPEYWEKAGPNGNLIPATREDIMMALDAIDMILLRADNNNAGVNITEFVMESAQHMNSNHGAASLVEECSCPEGYDGISCQKCKAGWVRENSGLWLGPCVRKQCPAGTYGDPSIGNACKPCPCPLTNSNNQFATTCSLGYDGSVTCDCFTGYEGQTCEKCAPGYEGNPLIAGDSCRVQPTHNCNPIGTRHEQLLDECVCKDHVVGRFCDQCKNGSFYLSNDFRHGCALCFCSGESQQCMSSNLRRKTTSINFNVPNIVEQVKVYNIQPQGNDNFRYTAPVETSLIPEMTRGVLGLSGLDRSLPTVYYWSMPLSFAGDKVTSYGGYLRYTLDNVRGYVDERLKNTAADIQLISENHLRFQYFGNFQPSNEGVLNVSVQLLEKGWQRSDGKEVPREHFLLALADVKTILIKATYSNDAIATPLYASIETAASDGNGPAAFHVEQCICPPGHIGTSCEDCATGYTRGFGGLYLAHCEACQCNGHSRNCHPETGQCFECLDNTAGPHCEFCKPGYEHDDYDKCVAIEGSTTLVPCGCDPRGEAEPCEADGSCTCKRNVDGEYCDRCRSGTFGLDNANPDGCIPCFCSGATNECQEANHYYRVAIPAPIFGDNYGGYTITDINAESIINDQFTPEPDRSELKYIFTNPADRELYWSLPVFPGNRVLSYGGSLSLRQEFQTNSNNMESAQGNDVILIGDDISVAWHNPNVLRSGESLTYRVPLREEGWTILNSAQQADRSSFMHVLKNLRRVLVKATLAYDILTTSIADVSMDTAVEQYQLNAQIAKGIEMCTCPPGHLGTSCETCAAGFYKNEQDFCKQCPCNGHDCQLDTNMQVVCNCRAPYTGQDCSTIGLLMELLPTLRDDYNPVFKHVTLTCKYRAAEPLAIKFVVEGQDQGPLKSINESILHTDGWHGEHVMETLWDTRDDGKRYECNTITQKGATLGVLFTDMRRAALEGGGQSQVTTNPPPMPESTITVRITSPTITIQEVGSSVNFTCQAQSPFSRRLILRWSKVDGNLPQDRTYIDEISGILRINNLQISDSGQYTCQTNDGRSTGQASVTLKVPATEMDYPSVKILTPVNEYYVGDRIELECVATGSPQPSISWQRASKRPLPSSYEQNDNVFVIDSAMEEHSGEYRCIASNTAGSVDSTAVITVRPRPAQQPRDKLVVQPTASTVNEGQSTTIVCTGSTNVPTGTIDWVRQDGDHFQANVRSENGVLFIDVATLTNAGVYVCQTHGADVTPEAVLLTVLTTAPSLPSQDPQVKVPVPSLKIPRGESNKIDCFPKGKPQPLIKWIRHDGKFGRGVSQRDNTLIINNAEESDAGYYICQGLDRRDRQVVSMEYVYVDIEKRDKPVVVVLPKGEQAVPLGNTQFEFHCRVLSGFPESEVTWSRAGGRTLSSHVDIKPNNILKFNKIEVNDEGEYICTADNLAGSSSASGVIKVRSPPEIVITPDNYQEVNEGMPVNVDCRADGYPEPWVTIRGPDGREVSSNTRIASLRLKSVSRRDDGDYTCSASNSAGTMEDTIVLRVETRGDGGDDYGASGDFEINPNLPEPRPNPYPYPYPYPNTTPRPTPNPYPGSWNWQNPTPVEQIVFEGKELNIFCNVSNNFDVRWDRGNRQPLQINAQQYDGRLVIYNVTNNDSGIYVCSASNKQTGEVQVALNTNIKVVGMPKITLKPPTQTVFPGDSTTVECVVEGDGILDITWLPTSQSLSSRVKSRHGTLIFEHIEVEDAGLYKCVARNQWANTSATAKVIVLEESDVASSESHSHEQWVHAGAGVMLSCNVSSAAGVIVRWTKDGGIVPKSIRTNPDGSLFIKIAQTTHSGQYVCLIRDKLGRQTSNYINLHIEGIECTDSEFRCNDNGSCIGVEFVCDGFADCDDNSDEWNCLSRIKRHAQSAAHERPLAKIDQPRRAFREGENVEVLCNSFSRDITVEWIKRDEHGNRQHVDFITYGDGSKLVIKGVTKDDAGVYLCISNNRFGQNYTDNFNLQIVPGSEVSNPRERNVPVREYVAKLRRPIDIPCNHDLEEPVSIRWQREYTALPNNVRTNQPFLHIRRATEGDAGTYVCQVSNSRNNAMVKAILRVTGVIPRFNGDSWVALPTLREAYMQFNIDISFKPTVSNGLIIYNSDNSGRINDFLALQLLNGVPEFIIEAGNGPVSVKGDRPLALNQWHTIRINKIATKVSMDVDNVIFEGYTPDMSLLELHSPLYIGGVPDYNLLPQQLNGARGFVGCVSMLLLGQEEKNIILDQLEQYEVSTCDTCAGNLCHNGSVCQEARTERGYVCICNKDFAGPNCDRRGEACRPGLCGTGKCTTTNDGYKCACPVTHTGKNCEIRQQIEYPAFTGSAYVALKPLLTARHLQISMKVKATAPVSDGIIMYSAESPRGHGGFTSLAVRNGRLEYRYYLEDDTQVILVSNTTLAANEWTDVQVTRSGTAVSLKINMVHTYEKVLNSAKSLKLETPMFIGGVDENIILNSNTGVNSGFMGCIKDLKTSGDILDIVKDHVESSNVQECTNIPNRGDIPETDLSTCHCKNGGTCVGDNCECLPGFTGDFCESRQASSLRHQVRAPAAEPCDAFPCHNGGTCRTDYSNRMNISCDCPLGYSGATCQMVLNLHQSVGFNGNGYLELPASLVNYETLDREPAIIAIRAYTVQDGVLVYQREAMARPGEGDYLMIRIENSHVVVEWDMGSGVSTLSVNSADGRDVSVTDGEMHRIVLKLLPNGRLELSVDGITEQGLTNGLTNRLNADSNIYIGGMPKSLNVNSYSGLFGCIDQVEFMNLGRGVNLGKFAAAARNTHPCRK